MVIHTKQKPVIRSKSARKIDKIETSIPAVSKDPRIKKGNAGTITKTPATSPKSKKGSGKSSPKEPNTQPQMAVPEKTSIHRKIKEAGYRPANEKEAISRSAKHNAEDDPRENQNNNRQMDAIKAHAPKITAIKDKNNPHPQSDIPANSCTYRQNHKQKYFRKSLLHPALMVSRDAVTGLDGGREINDSVQAASVMATPVFNAGKAGKNLYINKTAKSQAEKLIKRKDGIKNRVNQSTANHNNPHNNTRYDYDCHPPNKARKHETSEPSGNSANPAKYKYKKEDSIHKAKHKSANETAYKKTANDESASGSDYYGKSKSSGIAGSLPNGKSGNEKRYRSDKGHNTHKRHNAYKGYYADKKQHSNKHHRNDKSPLGNKSQNRNSPDNNSGKITRNRMIQLFIAQLKQESNEDSLIKALKDIAVMKFTILIKKAAAFIFLKLAVIFGITAIAALPVIAVIAIIYNSPFAILFPSISSAETTQAVLASYTSEFKATVENEANRHPGYDYSEIIYANYEGAGTPDNYIDILAVYMVRHGIGDTATDMTNKAKQNLKTIHDDMASYHITSGEIIKLEEVEVRDEYGFRVRDENGNIVTEWVEVTYKVKYVNVRLQTAHEMISRYGMNGHQKEMLLELMKPEYLVYIGYNPGGGTGITLTDDQFRAIVDTISDANGRKVVEFALSKVGYPYSQALRDSGTHFDCSSLTFYAWRAAGVNLTYQGSNTAAQQGKMLHDNSLLVNYSNMRPGDLIFYSTASNGRFSNITHVSIYTGNGMMVDAASSSLGVVYRAVRTNNIVFIGRPR